MVKRVRKKPGTKRKSFLITVFLVTGALVTVYWLYSCLFNTIPRLNHIEISRNGDFLRISEGETLRLHPMDKVKILNVSTNICFNHGILLTSELIDAESLRRQELPLVDLLPGREALNRYSSRIQANRFDIDAGHINIIVEPYVEDWVDRFNRSIGHERRIAILERALDLEFIDSRIIDRLVNEYISNEMWDKAAARLDKLAEARPDEETYLKLIRVYSELSMTDRVISVFRNLIGISPENTDYVIQLAETLEDAGRISDAVREYEGLTGKMKGEDLALLYKKLGFLSAESRQTDKAIEYYTKALEMDSKDVNLYYNLSALHESKKQNKLANQYLAKALELQSGDTEGRLRLADRLIKSKDYKTAETYLQEVLKKNPNSMDAWLLMVELEEKRGNRKGLTAAYKKIISLDPKNSNAVYNLGVLEYEAGNLDNALAHLESYVKSYPRDINTRSILFDIYRKKKRNDLAYREAMNIVNARPGERTYYPFIFEHLDSAGDYKGMVKIMEAAVKARPNDVEIRKYLLIAYLNSGNDKQAAAQIEEILKRAPNDVSMLMQLARLKEKMGELNSALDIYKRVIDIAPENEEAEKAYLRVRLEILAGS